MTQTDDNKELTEDALERKFVIPGDEIVKSMEYLPGRNCFRDGHSIYAKRLGLASVKSRVISVIPLSGVYIPRIEDMVIGEIKEIQSNGWIIDINAPYNAYLSLSGVRGFIDTAKTSLSSVYNIGDVIYAKIIFCSGDFIQVSMLDARARKFKEGRIVKISPAKVPRLIGKEGSMISLIKNNTGTRISVGRNGLVWVDGEKSEVVISAIEMVENMAHTEGLTDKISEMLGVQDVDKVVEDEKIEQ